ncbi:uncharacterized protein AB675_11595 [Cyphellophora attinorum]|uniref:DUF7053 domain-containing protein n=1 Tax=Cyphellophora attinorum TaxID=1664694 RepID=A0A0N1NYI1_9EURO|nr:uncharacterized protein AB675_11595 [Phialophora attinorum]KPI39852.1 hypothetical protein AB675_11595 [Phialophora attinorum]
MSLRSKKNVTLIRPIPAFIPRALALDVLHDHSEVITLNPLVLSHRAIAAPIDAPPDEALSRWYEITERIQFIPGLGKAGSSTINFNGVFHDVPWGLQTHIYAPMNIDMRAQYRIAGSQPGVDQEPAIRELGLEKLGAPKEGLYLRADVEFKANVALAGFVKSESVKAIGEMVQRMVQRAEKLDADVLQGMIRDEREVNLGRVKSADGPQPQLAWQLRQSQSQGSVPHLSQTQSMPVQQCVSGRDSWPTEEQKPRHANTDPIAQELPSPPTIQYSSFGRNEQQPQIAYQQKRSSYAPPTHVVELDNTEHSAGSEQSGWSAGIADNGSTDSNGAYPYPDVRSPSQGRSPSREAVQQQNTSTYQHQQQAPSPQPQQTQSQQSPYAYTYNPADYQKQPQVIAQSKPFYPLPSQQQSYQQQYSHYQQPQQQQPAYPQTREPEMRERERGQKVPQFQEGRKYSFDEARLQPEALNVGSFERSRRWSGVGVGE